MTTQTNNKRQKPTGPKPQPQPTQKIIQDIESSKPQPQVQQIQERQLLIFKQRQNNEGHGISSTDKYHIERKILQSEVLNGKIFYLNKTPMKEHFWEALNRTNHPNNYKHYDQFIILAQNQQERQFIKDFIFYERVRYQDMISSQFRSQLSQQYQKNTNIQIKYDGYPSPDNLVAEPKTLTYEYLPFCVVVPSFNTVKNQQNYKRNINSILQQEYSNYHVVYVDDSSEDQTTDKLIDYIKGIYNESATSHNNLETEKPSEKPQIIGANNQETTNHWFNGIKWTFVKNNQRKYALQSIYEAIHQHCGDRQIAIIVEGDDALIGTQVLVNLNYFYRLKRHLFVYSNYFYKSKVQFNESIPIPQEWSKIIDLLQSKNTFIESLKKEYMRLPERLRSRCATVYEMGPGSSSFPYDAIARKTVRSSQNLFASHLLTFYVSLFKKIHISNFQDQNNQFFKYAYGRALTLPLAELALKYTSSFREFLYEFNANSEAKDSPQNWAESSVKIRQKVPVEELVKEDAIEMIKKVLKQ